MKRRYHRRSTVRLYRWGNFIEGQVLRIDDLEVVVAGGPYLAIRRLRGVSVREIWPCPFECIEDSAMNTFGRILPPRGKIGIGYTDDPAMEIEPLESAPIVVNVDPAIARHPRGSRSNSLPAPRSIE